jgi:ankyrin repeat protein
MIDPQRPNAGADVHVEDAHGAQPVHYAAAAGSMEKLTALTNAGADLDAVTHNGFTALCWAAQVGARVAPQALFSRSRPSLSLSTASHTGLPGRLFVVPAWALPVPVSDGYIAI